MMKEMKKNTPKIKICGLTRMCDIEYVNEAKPDYIGFVFAESKRKVSGKEAELLRSHLAEGISVVGVFVDAPPEEILSLVRSGIIDMIQLHGNETPGYIEVLKSKGKFPVIKAMHPDKQKEEQLIDAYHAYKRAGTDFFLFDSSNGGKNGGTGKTFEWSLIPILPVPYFLAGGLHVGNIEQALSATAPYGVDISSGVETAGKKDRDKILEIVRRIRNV